MMWRFSFPFNIIVLLCVLAFSGTMFAISLDRQDDIKHFIKKHKIIGTIYVLMVIAGAGLLIWYFCT